MLKAVLFDLDGTLLPVDTGEFMEEYLKDLAGTVHTLLDPQLFVKALLASTSAVMDNKDPEITNADVFWGDFRRRLGDCINELEPLLERFYAERFGGLIRVARPSPQQARKSVEAALDRGLKIVLATQPIYPLSAIRQRMSWAGIEDMPWDLVTSYKDMHFCKPAPEYYLEIAGRLELHPGECIMVGNDVLDDISAAKAGMKTYLVTDYLIDKKQEDLRPDWTGRLAELAGWLADA